MADHRGSRRRDGRQGRDNRDQRGYDDLGYGGRQRRDTDDRDRRGGEEDRDRTRRYRSRSRDRRDRNRSPERDPEREHNRDRDGRRPPRDQDRDRNRDQGRGRRDRDEGRQGGRPGIDRAERPGRDALEKLSRSASPRRSASPPARREPGGPDYDYKAAQLPTRSKGDKNGTSSATMSFKVGAASGRDEDRRGRSSGGDDHSVTPMDEDEPRGRVGLVHGGDVYGDDDLEVEQDDDMAAMQAMMGFGGFGTTKGSKVAGNNIGGVRKEKKTEYRQYMNRTGGFNRPLSPSR